MLNVGLDVLLIHVGILFKFWRLETPICDQRPLNCAESICESEHSENEDDEEDNHALDASYAHPDKPAKRREGLKVKQDLQPYKEGRPSLHCPEALQVEVTVDRVVHDQERRDPVCKSLQA